MCRSVERIHPMIAQTPTRKSLHMLGLCAGLLLASCSNTRYVSRHVARGELTLGVRAGGLEIYRGAEHQRIASSWGRWQGLEEYVRCAKKAQAHAKQAESHGNPIANVGIALVGLLGGGGFFWGGVAADNNGVLLGIGTIFSAISVGAAILIAQERNVANGHAVDAMNYYNDAVGSLGATCKDLKYQQPAVVIEPLEGASEP